MFELKCAVDIRASAEDVWHVLTDFPSYPEWNPLIRTISGPLKRGGRLTFRVQPPVGPEMTVRVKCLAVHENRELRWRGRFLLARIFQGEHAFELIPVGAQHTRFVQHEKFSGFLVPLLRARLNGRTQRGFEAMNRALKRRVERAARHASARS